MADRVKRSLTPASARRLAITRQRLAGRPSQPNRRGIMSVIRALGCLQLDPISVVARSPLLVLWSRTRPRRSDRPRPAAVRRSARGE